MVSCSNCRESHTACDSGRPCKRCVSTGRAHTCRDAAVRKRGRKPVSFSMDGSHISIDPLTNVTSTPSFSFSPATPSQPTFSTTNKNLAVHNKNFTPQPTPTPPPQPQPSFHHYPPFTPSPSSSSSSSSYEGRRAQPIRGKEEKLQGKEREADYEEQQPPPEQSFSNAASSSAPPPFGPYCCCGNCHGTTNNERGGRFKKRNKRATSFEGEEEEEDEEEHHLLAAIRAMMKTHMEEIRNDMDGLRGLLLKTQTDIDALRQTISPPTAKYSPHSSSYSSYSPSSLNPETSSPHSSSIINYPAPSSSSSSSVTVDVCCSTSPPPSPLSLLYSSSFNTHNNNNNFPSYSCDIPLPFPFSPPQPHQQSAFPPYLPTLTDSSSSSSSSSLSSASAVFTSNRHTLPGWVLVVQQRIRQKPFAIVKAEFSQTDNAIVSLNRAFCSIFGKHPEDLIDTPASFIRKLLTRSNNADAKLHIEKVDFTKKPDSHELKFSISISPHPSSSASAQQHMVLAMNILVQRFLDEGGAPQWTILTVEEKTLRPVHPPPSGSPIFSAVEEQPSLSSSYFAPPQMYSSPSSSSSSSPLFSSSSSSDPSSYSSSPLMTMMEEQEQVQQTATPSASIPTSASVEDLLYLANNYSSTMSSAASSVFDVSFHPLIPPSPPPSTSFLHPEE
ncbi:Conserved repeat domain [Balamuthia mandrillaris]